MKFLVTGAAGFIGFHTIGKLLKRGTAVVGIDTVNDYYDTALKEARLAELQKLSEQSNVEFTFLRDSIADLAFLNKAFADHRPSRVINLAAQPGVRYSLENPHAYVESNVVGFTNLLEACRHHGMEHLV
ncbi:MAG: GDP-mannose 4,6-dehydratase, partial [Pseudomonadota bacterium]